jgi:RsiW-degrading membrane proteinase PrsW (M82 family)
VKVRRDFYYCAMIINYILYSLLALLVAYLWLSYLRLVDVFQPENWKRLGITFLIGCFSVGPILGLHELFPSFFYEPSSAFGWFWYYLIKVGLLEEICKLGFAVISIQYFIKEKEPVDYVVHAAAAALGFATVENVLYLSDYGPEIIRGRAGFSAMIHMACSAVPMYFYIRDTKLGNKDSVPFLSMMGGLILASVIHGLYDFSIKMGGLGLLIMLMVYLISLELWLTFINNLLNISPHFKKNISPDYSRIQKLFITGFLVLSAIEFIYSFAMNGWDSGYIIHLIRIPLGAIFLIILVMSKLSKIRLIPGKQFPLLYQMSFAFNPKSFIANSPQGKFSSASFDVRVDSVNEMEISSNLYRKVKLVSRDNSQGEIIGIITDKIWGNEDEVFFRFDPIDVVQFKDYRQEYWALKAQTMGNTFFRDIYSEVFALLVPNHLELDEKSMAKNFPAYGRFYIVPLDE